MIKICTRCGETKLKTEFSNNACKHDGLATYCKACSKMIAAKYYAANREKIKAASVKWNVANAAKALANCAKWRAANPDRVKANNTKHRASNHEIIRIYRHNRRSRKRNAVGTHTAADIRALLTLQKSKCACCKTSIKDGYHVDHVLPLVKGGRNDRFNLQLLCASCNLSKGAKHPIDFMQSRGYLI